MPLDPSGPYQRDPQGSRIQLDSNLRRWFSRNLGLWRSRRLYFFRGEDEPLRLYFLLRIETYEQPVEGEAAYRFSWTTEQDFGFYARKPQYQREGSLEAYLCGHQLRRSHGSLADHPMRSQIRQVDEHQLIFESQHQDWDIEQHIRLIDRDRLRACSIFSWRDGELGVTETHHEIRLEGPGDPLPAD
ncbi:hypothetical protein KBY78_15745 [Synechococcus sp. EJ6-Ellesmere]|nr:hypothetical protein [Synechococcus sp. EJ6-Ellesmere]